MSTTPIDIPTLALELIKTISTISPTTTSPTAIALILCANTIKLISGILTTIDKRQVAIDIITKAITLLPENSPVRISLDTISFMIPELIDYSTSIVNNVDDYILKASCWKKCCKC